MGDKNLWKREVDFDRLNWVGKAIFLTGQVARAAGAVVETVVEQASSLAGAAERAFIEGLGEEIEEAKVLEEESSAGKQQQQK